MTEIGSVRKRVGPSDIEIKQRGRERVTQEEKESASHAVSEDMSFPLCIVSEAATAELTGQLLLHTLWPTTAAGTHWEIQFNRTRQQRLAYTVETK